MKKKNPIIAILLTIIFAMAPFGAVANALTQDEINVEVAYLNNNPITDPSYQDVTATDPVVAAALDKPSKDFNNMKETEVDAEGNFTGVTWVTRSRLAAAAKYRTQVIIRQGESR